jgi:hypothetical protein
MKFDQGKTYEFTLSGGVTLTLRYDGLGKNMQQVWYEPSTGATTHLLPPFTSYREV